MAFVIKAYDSIKTASFGTSLTESLGWGTVCKYLMSSQSVKIANAPNWLNLGNYSTSGTSSTSGTGGTTIIAAGNYTWIG